VPQLPHYVDTAFDDDELLRAAIALVSGDLKPALDVLSAAGNVVLPDLLNAAERFRRARVLASE